MGATHFKAKTLRNVATEMALHVLAYNIKRVIAILGIRNCSEQSRDGRSSPAVSLYKQQGPSFSHNLVQDMTNAVTLGQA